MKRIALVTIISIAVIRGHAQEKTDSFSLLTPVEVRAIRAGDNAPFTKTNLSKADIQKQNTGQDLPFLLNQTPAVVVSSDAGNGVGYTGIRIRGTDATRINMTINGIPYNDAESQGLFFVNLPDLASSVNSIQVQRGVGTSSNGAGAFGATINFSTNEVNKEAYAEFNNSYGSFQTWKNTIKAGSGLVGNHFTTDIRLSRISSNGYIDRASTSLQSFYFSTAYLSNKSSLRLNIFSGKEKTYQAWYGVSEADLLAGNRRVNYAGTEKPGDPYDNETDNYTQSHYQLFFDHRFSEKLVFNTALFLTNGKGYYEQYKADREYADYHIPNPSPAITSSDFVRQLWLDNDFYGNVISMQYNDNISRFTLGGGYTRYTGNHFGELTWAAKGLPAPKVRWYDHDARKNDFNIFFKEQTRFAKYWHLFYDLQYRTVSYAIDGFRDNPGVSVKNRYHFFNPKAGIHYSRNGWNLYGSYSIGNKEPNRDDFEAGTNQQPRREQLHDIELAAEKKQAHSAYSVTLYYMRYKDQLVLTGEVNDVGAYTRTNIPRSYRLGAELQANATPISWLRLSGSLALSRNKVLDFTEYIDDYDNGGQKTNQYKSADIAFSPALVGNAVLSFMPVKQLEASLLSKYVSRQYLDNTGNTERMLNAFYVQDFRLIYTLPVKWLQSSTLSLQVNNLFAKKYEPNGYTFSYLYGGSLTTENYYFPMAGRNYTLSATIRL